MKLYLGNYVSLIDDQNALARVVSLSKTKADIQYINHPIYGNAIREYPKSQLKIAESQVIIMSTEENKLRTVKNSDLVTIQTYAILKSTEEETFDCEHDKLYKFRYDTIENFYVIINGRAIEETSTAFNFLTVQQ